MAFFRATFDFIKGRFSRQSQSDVDDKVGRDGIGKSKTHQRASAEEIDGDGQHTDDRKRWLGHRESSRKRKPSDSRQNDARKKTKGISAAEDLGYRGGPGNDEVVAGVQPKHNKLDVKQNTDRHMMSPPSIPINSKTKKKSHPRSSLTNLETASESQSHISRRGEMANEYDMEAARRKAAATELPAASGIWETAEKELFFHLSYRGFEPLLPTTWMKDFPTLPISLFETAHDTESLIQVHNSSEFRGIKALRDLIDTGKLIRDRTISSNQELRSEPLIEKAINRYLRWAFKDMRIPIKQCVPVHVITSMKPGQTTQDTIRHLTIKMHNLSARHRRACNIHPSIERDQSNSPAGSNGETQLIDDTDTPEENLPVIHGMMICRTLLAIFTLNSHTSPPRFVRQALGSTEYQDIEPDGENADGDENGDEESGLRFIASFDFSDGASDVWNAFVIAIVSMMVRKTMVEIYDIPTEFDGQDYEESVLDNSLIEAGGAPDDDPDL